MNERIENILHRAPKVKAPAGLAEKLKADISLPHASATANATDFWAGFRRWFPGFATAALFLTCLVALGVQSNTLSELRKQNQQLEASLGDVEQLRRENAEYQSLAAENQQLEQLRKDNQELERLRSEVTQLREQTQELAHLRAENQRLLAQQKSAQIAGTQGEEDPFAAAKKKAQSTMCVSNLKQVGLGLRMWANEHKDGLPPDFLTAQNELNSPKILVCPSDTARTKRLPTWTGFGAADASYEFLTPGLPEAPPWNTIMTRCPIHGHVGLIDGSVQQDSWKHATQRESRWLLERKN